MCMYTCTHAQMHTHACVYTQTHTHVAFLIPNIFPYQNMTWRLTGMTCISLLQGSNTTAHATSFEMDIQTNMVNRKVFSLKLTTVSSPLLDSTQRAPLDQCSIPCTSIIVYTCYFSTCIPVTIIQCNISG